MPTSAAVSAAASRCCNQLGLARRFSSAVSISSPPLASSSSSSSATCNISSNRKVGPKAFSTAAYVSNSHKVVTGIRPFFATDGGPAIGVTATSSSSIHTNANDAIFGNNCSSSSSSDIIRRSMATSNRKVIDAKNAKRLKIQQKKKKNTNASKAASNTDEAKGTEDAAAKNENPFLQHQEWVRFQQSITVDGFQTGQTTTATVLKKSRGGKQARRKREKELARLGAYSDTSGSEKISAVAQKFPAIRYSPEETEALLKRAYEVLPARTGKRGTRNLRRQATRWKKVRKIRSDYKAQLVRAHFNRMAARKYKRDRTNGSLEAAPGQRQDDLDYQGMVLKRWMETMGNDGSTTTSV